MTDLTDLTDKVIVVTGGASGLGRAYCNAFAGQGSRVLVADLDSDGAEAFAEELRVSHGSDRARASAVNVSVASDARRMVADAIDAFGRVDVLVNNAGTYPHERFEHITEESWRHVMAVNLDGTFHCCQATLPVMRAAGGGVIVNIATNLVWGGLAGMVHYVAAKAGVIGLTRALAREVGPYSIRVNAIAPGAVPPPLEMLSEAGRATVAGIVSWQCLPRAETASDLLGAMCFLASERSAFISGQVLTVDGGLTMH